MLLVFAHPRCPCTRATLAELGKLMTHQQGQVSVTVLFVTPRDPGAGWGPNGLWAAAEAIPGVRARADAGGEEAARFGAATSGQAALYGRDGALRFSGGITGSRGHEGDNPGLSALTEALGPAGGRGTNAPVYGCPLFDPVPASREGPGPCQTCR